MANRIVHVPAGEGQRLNTVDSMATVKVGAADTNDQYELFELEAPDGSAVPPHRHPWAEAYYVLEGDLGVQVGGRHFRLRSGDTVSIPPNAVHTIAPNGGTCRFLVISMSAGSGSLFADLDRSVPTDQPMEAVVPVLLEVAARNGVSFVGAHAVPD
jgi:quercetin dioxygenase-like cupin family protein